MKSYTVEQQKTPLKNIPESVSIPAPAGKMLGVPVWGLRLIEFVELAKNLIKAKHKALFTTINAHPLARVQTSQEFFNHFLQADVVLPDGILTIWLARMLKYEVPERVPGPDFVESFLPVAEKENFRIFFMGSTNETLEKLKYNCLRKYPRLNIVGLLAPPFGEFDSKTNYQIVSAINRKNPDVLFVGMSAPRQELWLSRNFERLNVRFAMGVGAAFDYLAGNKRRAPKWLGNMGFEWLYRLVHEPRRLWQRNVSGNISLLRLLAKKYIAGTVDEKSNSSSCEDINPHTK